MTHILLIMLTIYISEHESKNFEFRIPYSNIDECLIASKKINYSHKFPDKIIKTSSECIANGSLII